MIRNFFEPVCVQFEIRNFSKYPISLVWENAQDLEHVAHLHPRTNSEFELLYSFRYPNSSFAYDFLSFRTKRKALGFLPISTFGIRRIVKEAELHQLETIPLLGIKVALVSRLEIAEENPYQTVLVDSVTIQMPRFLYPLRNFLEENLRRHTRIQCEEDEPFRQRRLELNKRGIHLPFRLFRDSWWKTNVRSGDEFEEL